MIVYYVCEDIGIMTCVSSTAYLSIDLIYFC